MSVVMGMCCIDNYLIVATATYREFKATQELTRS